MKTLEIDFEELKKQAGPVECLGQTFPNDEARREYFLALLREKLKDPEFRKIEGFPIGTDEDILAMSDPPYYTACPNPFLDDFVRHYGKPYDPNVKYAREPLAVDVSVGKTDPIYKAHAYHTKVPHLAIVPSILHYTKPGDLVLDGFAGSGMTGVAAQWCGSAPAAYRHELETEWKKQGRPAPKWGARRAILNDLSPAATFIAANYNLPFDVEAFAQAGKRLLKEVEDELGWMYETLHTDGKTIGRIEYTVWSEVFTCPHCAGEVNFLDEALDDDSKRVKETFPCPHCSADLNKDNLERVFESRIDPVSGVEWRRVKFQPSLISYTVGGKSYLKQPDQNDKSILQRVEDSPSPPELPTTRFPIEKMYHGSRIEPKGFTHVHNFFLSRSARVIGGLWGRVNRRSDTRIKSLLKFWLDSHFVNLSILNRYRPEVSFPYNPLTGVYYVPSLISEASPFTAYENKLKRIIAAFRNFAPFRGGSQISSGSASNMQVPDSSIDYIFTDPPFGENIFYADLNFLVESWHRVVTDAQPEAIVDKFKKKGLPEYQHLMQRCFAEYFRVLKPGRWMTVVFSNSKAAVWNTIQVALQQAGFVVAEVTALDKVQGSYRQVTSTTAVKQDLVISAYKPNGGLEDRFSNSGASVESAWDFVQTHLRQLPGVKTTYGEFPELVKIVERDPRRIYDRMASWFIRHDKLVPISTPEFLAELPQRFAERDGMIFLPDQVVEYDKKRMQIPQARQVDWIVSDERSAIDWLSDFLKRRPSTYPEIHTEYIPQVGAAKKKGETIPELLDLLKGNFLEYSGSDEVPSQIHSYLSTNFKDLRGLDKTDPRLIAKAKDRWYVPDPNKAQDLEKKREKSLLKEFETYRTFTGRRLKEFRLEAMRAGFKDAFARADYKTIIAIAEKLPEDALQEDEKLLTLYDLAVTRTEMAG
jgi:DNA modification methylase